MIIMERDHILNFVFPRFPISLSILQVQSNFYCQRSKGTKLLFMTLLLGRVIDRIGIILDDMRDCGQRTVT